MVKKGFTLIEMMIGLLFISSLLIIVLNIFLVLNQSKDNRSLFNQNKIGLFQLERELLFSSNFTLEDNSLCYLNQQQNYCLEPINNQLIKTPGYEFVLVDVENLSFNLLENRIELSFIEEGELVEKNFEVWP